MTGLDGNLIEKSSLIAPKKILVATDLTDGEYLVPHAVAQARACGASVTLVHAILPAETLPLDAGGIAYVDWAKTEQDIQVALLGLAAQIESHGIECDVIAKHGFAAEVLEEEIKETRATRLIMASHGRGKWGQFMMGSVAHQILGKVSIPVFVVGPRSASFPEHANPRKILHPVSLDGDYRRGVELAIELARTFHAELTLLHIPDRDVEASIHPGCTLTWAENLFATLVPKSPVLEHPIQVTVAFGNLVDEIRKGAARIGADWIVLGVDESLPFWPLKDSTAYKVVAVAECPVFAFRHDAYAREHWKVAHSAALSAIG
jgi:nucleotide-binding universal stress UspA family protein